MPPLLSVINDPRVASKLTVLLSPVVVEARIREEGSCSFRAWLQGFFFGLEGLAGSRSLGNSRVAGSRLFGFTSPPAALSC